MSEKHTKKDYFRMIMKKVRSYKGDKKHFLGIYRKFLIKWDELYGIRKPRITDLMPTFTCRSKNFYLERGWSDEDSTLELKKIQGCRYEDEEVKNRAVEKCRVKMLEKSQSEIERINKSKGSNYKDPERFAKRYNISIEEAEKAYAERTKKKTDSIKQTFSNIGGYKKEWSSWCKEFWLLRGYSEEDALKEVKKRTSGTRSIKSIMERRNCSYEEAKKFYDKVTEKINNTFFKRSPEEIEEIYNKRRKSFRHYSNASMEFFTGILDELNLPDDIMVYRDKTEYYLWHRTNDKNYIYFYDFCIPRLKIIIEYNGAMFHPRVKDTKFITVEKSIQKDNLKENIAKDNGFDIYWCWETDDLEQKKDEFINIIRKKYEEYRTKNDT